MTKKEFTKRAENAWIDKKLINATVKQLGGWNEFKLRAPDICRYGAGGGVPGFIYYDDTIEFFNRSRIWIKLMFMKAAEDAGVDVHELFPSIIKQFSIPMFYEILFDPSTAWSSDEGALIKNVLTWATLENIASLYTSEVK